VKRRETSLSENSLTLGRRHANDPSPVIRSIGIVEISCGAFAATFGRGIGKCSQRLVADPFSPADASTRQ
jgi:hypothetical protein